MTWLLFSSQMKWNISTSKVIQNCGRKFRLINTLNTLTLFFLRRLPTMRKKTDLRFALGRGTLLYNRWIPRRYPRLMPVLAMWLLSADRVMRPKAWDISAGQCVIAMLQKAARHSRGPVGLWEEVRRRITNRYCRMILKSIERIALSNTH